jgi:mannosyl-3-phosphoglycerate phosphatase
LNPTAGSASTWTSGILFSDLDGTLLDHESYLPSETAISTLRRLEQSGVKVVAVTSKTAAEVRELLFELRLDPPAVVEGGGAILDGDGVERVIGLPHERLVAMLPALREAGAAVRGFSEMSATELAQRSGLDSAKAALAKTRAASEPFVVLHQVDVELERRMAEVAESLGASVTRGGRFWHLTGRDIDKASGVQLILEGWPGGAPHTAAVGDAWNDLPMLSLVDQGFLLGNAVPDSRVPRGVIRLAELGPTGFVEAVTRLAHDWNLPVVE